jgi:hypothetical protein
MSLTSGFTQVCDIDCSGGVLNVAVMDKNDIESITWDDGSLQTLLASITLKAGATRGFRKIILDIEKISYSGVETKNDANCGYSATAEVTLTVDCATYDFTNFVQELKNLCCSGLVVAVNTSSGTRILGIRDGEKTKVQTVTDTVEQNYDGRNDTALVLMHKGRRSPAFWDDYDTLPFVA